MRFIVDVFRLIILAGVALIVVGISFIVFRVLMDKDGTAALDATTILAACAVLIVIILSLGMLATIISAHDRLTVVSEQVTRIADVMEVNTKAHGEVP